MFSLLLAFKRSCDFVSWSRVPDFLMTSITAYLTALAHSSSKQRVLKADIQTSTGDTDVCRQKCIVSVFKRRRLERCELLLLLLQRSQLQTSATSFELLRFRCGSNDLSWHVWRELTREPVKQQNQGDVISSSLLY